MKIPVKFASLIQLMEASDKQPVPTPVRPPSFNPFSMGIRAAARGIARGLKTAITDPAGAANSIDTFRREGIAKGLSKFGKLMSAEKRRAIDNYYFKLDFPAGWPKRGSVFEIAASDGIYIGKVRNFHREVNDNLVFVVDAQSVSRRNSNVRRYVIEMSTASRPYFSLRSVMVSDYVNGRFAKNEAESGHSFVVNYLKTNHSPNGAFVLSLNKTYKVYVPTDHVAGTVLTDGSRIRGNDIHGNLVEGVVVGVDILKDVKNAQGKPTKVYVVEANFK